jgi:hypothetical protein
MTKDAFRNAYKILMGKPGDKRPRNVEVDGRRILNWVRTGYEDVDSIHLSQDSVQGQGLEQ